MVYLILSILLVVCAIGWGRAWYEKQLLVAFLTIKKIKVPTVDELRECARLVKKNLFRW